MKTKILIQKSELIQIIVTFTRCYLPNMTKKSIFIFILTFSFVCFSFGQKKILSVKQHNIIVDIPKNWVEKTNTKMSFYLFPKKKVESEKTSIYLYVYNLREKNININPWIDHNIELLKEKNPNVKVDSLFNKFDNLIKDKYLSGRYRMITYRFPDKRKEAQLVIETKNTIITATLSAENRCDFRRQFKVYKKFIQSIKISNSFSVMKDTNFKD